MANTNQTDTDRDNVGDACDNCPKTSNSGQVRSEINERHNLYEKTKRTDDM